MALAPVNRICQGNRVKNTVKPASGQYAFLWLLKVRISTLIEQTHIFGFFLRLLQTVHILVKMDKKVNAFFSLLLTLS